MAAPNEYASQGATPRESRTVIRPVERNQRIKLQDAILVAGFPGPGLVGSMSVSYIIEQQKMHQIAYVDSDFIMPGVMFIGGRLRHPSFITGISGALLASCLSSGIPCTGILLPSLQGIPDPEGAAILIETANRIASNPFKIDVAQLKNQAAAIKKEMQQLLSAMQKQQLDAAGPSGPEIYG